MNQENEILNKIDSVIETLSLASKEIKNYEILHSTYDELCESINTLSKLYVEIHNMIEPPELKNCPFCGFTVKIERDEDDYGDIKIYIFCESENDNCPGKYSMRRFCKSEYEYMLERFEIIENWNNRKG